MVYSGSGGFSICTRRADLCDATLSLNNWQIVPPDKVVQVSIFKNFLMAAFLLQETSVRFSIRIGHNKRPLVLAYLWAETPVR